MQIELGITFPESWFVRPPLLNSIDLSAAHLNSSSGYCELSSENWVAGFLSFPALNWILKQSGHAHARSPVRGARASAWHVPAAARVMFMCIWFSTSVVAFGLMLIDMYLLCVYDHFNIELQILTASVQDIRDFTTAIESPTKRDLYLFDNNRH